MSNFKYKTVDEIKQTKQFQQLRNKVDEYRYCSPQYMVASFELFDYFYDELGKCEEVIKSIESHIRTRIDEFADVKNVNF